MIDIGFFEDLSLFGWLGILVWALLPISIYVKQDWYFNYDRRKPQIRAFDEFCYTYERQFVFMIVRFLVIVMVGIMVGRILTWI